MYRELATIQRAIKYRMRYDAQRPYRVRAKQGDPDRFGKANFSERTVKNMLTQPLSTEEFDRLAEGDRKKTWRFAGVIAPDELSMEEQVWYKGRWFEVKKINDWDGVQSAHIVAVD